MSWTDGYLTHPEHTPSPSADAPPGESVSTPEDDEQREQDAHWLLSEMIDFRKKYGWRALLQLLPACADGQRDLPL